MFIKEAYEKRLKKEVTRIFINYCSKTKIMKATSCNKQLQKFIPLALSAMANLIMIRMSNSFLKRTFRDKQGKLRRKLNSLWTLYTF